MARHEVKSDNGSSGSGTSLRRKYFSKDITKYCNTHAHFHNDVKIFHCSNYSLLKILCVKFSSTDISNENILPLNFFRTTVCGEMLEGLRTYAYQTFGSNKLVNHLCSTFKTFQRQVLVGLNFGELTTICQICQYLTLPIFHHVW